MIGVSGAGAKKCSAFSVTAKGGKGEVSVRGAGKRGRGFPVCPGGVGADLPAVLQRCRRGEPPTDRPNDEPSWGRTEISVDGRPAGVFSGGGRTDSVEAFAGAQGQRVKRGFEATEKERRVACRELVERRAAVPWPKAERTHNGPVMRRWPVRPSRLYGCSGAPRKSCPPRWWPRGITRNRRQLARFA